MSVDYGAKLRGRVVYFLGLMLLHHFSYPLSELSDAASALYVVFYCFVIGFGAYLTSLSKARWRLTATVTALTLVTGVIWAFTGNDTIINGALYIFYVVIIFNILLIIITMAEFIFSATKITRDILYAGVALYMLIGNLFTPTYLFLNALVTDITGTAAFGVHTYEVEITWQRMYYLSFTVLTTLGFGDITPVHPVVEPFVLAEAALGVLYVAIMMARLVSLYEGPKTVVGE